VKALAILCVMGGVAFAQGAGSGSGTGTGSGSAKTIEIPMDASAPVVNAAASPSSIMLGARFTLFVTAVYDAGVEVNLREPFDLGPELEVTRRVSDDHVRPDGKHERDWQIEVYAWELGDLQVPPVAVTFTVAGRAGQVQTGPVPLHVSGVLGDVDDPKLMRADAPPVALTSRAWLWIWIGGSVLAAILVVVIAVWRARRRRRKVDELVAGASGHIPVRRIDTTGERALERLLEIERSGVLDVDDSRKRGYAEMVDVIRDYLGHRYRVATLDLTTAELVRALARVAPAGERTLVETWLERCDVVKYGGSRARVEDAMRVLADAKALVIATSANESQEAA
jgi:hypothetical protein